MSYPWPASSSAAHGVSRLAPSRADLAADRIGRNDAEDRFIGALRVSRSIWRFRRKVRQNGGDAPDREEAWVRRLFEKAVLGFARAELEPLGWSVRGSIPLVWQFSSSGALSTILPHMVTDIVLDAPNADRRLIIDTKFTSVLRIGRFGDASLKSEYLYQMYAYLRSQEGLDCRCNDVEGLFIHPAMGAALHEHVVIQGHEITFAQR